MVIVAVVKTIIDIRVQVRRCVGRAEEGGLEVRRSFKFLVCA